MYYPNTAWMCLRRDVFEKLYKLKVDNGNTSWEQLLEELLDAQNEAVRS
jgi:predicted CopG family antitoxin